MSIQITETTFQDIVCKNFDLVIASSGFEERASFQIQHLQGSHNKKVCFRFDTEKQDPNRMENDRIFTSLAFEQYELKSEIDDIKFLQHLMEKVVEKGSDIEIDVYVDYSIMTRNIYAGILYVLHQRKFEKKINVYFGYSFAKYTVVEKQDILNQVVEPIHGFCKVSIPYKPTALIICLGNEKNRVYGLREFFDATTYLFYSDTKFENPYSVEVEEVNMEILQSTPQEQIFKFPIEDLVFTDHMLENLCTSLSKKYRVVLAPCGPKPFTLLSLLNSIKLKNEIEVWRISPGQDLQKIDRKASGKVSVLKVSFNNHVVASAPAC